MADGSTVTFEGLRDAKACRKAKLKVRAEATSSDKPCTQAAIFLITFPFRKGLHPKRT
jgi:hypothetical protein